MSSPNPLVIGTLLALGIGTMYWVSKKTTTKKVSAKKSPSFLLFDDNCKETTTPPPSDEEGQKFVLKHFEMYKKQVPLGPPPGSYDANTAWAHGFVEHMFKQMASPKCVVMTTVDPDSEEPPMAYPAVMQFKMQLTLGVAAFLMDRGYTVVGSMGPITPDMPGGPGMESSGTGPSLIDVVRGLA